MTPNQPSSEGSGLVHLVQFSTGLGSAEVAVRVYNARAEGDRVVLLTGDTLIEDEDNWRFAQEVIALMPEAEWVILRDGRTPMEVGRSERCVPNNRMAVCSRVLKRELIRGYLDEHFDPTNSIVYLGYDWTEEHRFTDAVEPWKPWSVRCPLMEKPWMTKGQLIEFWRSEHDIEPPRLYAAGFSHANCGGGCVRSGQSEWRRLLFWSRDRYLGWESEEEATRDMLGKDVAILRHRGGPKKGQPLTLREFREQLERDAFNFDTDDPSACGCDPWAA